MLEQTVGSVLSVSHAMHSKKSTHPFTYDIE